MIKCNDGLKLEHKEFCLTRRKTFLLWEWLSTSTHCPENLWSLHLRIFKIQLDIILGNLFYLTYLSKGVWTRWSQEVLSNLKGSVILWKQTPDTEMEEAAFKKLLLHSWGAR